MAKAAALRGSRTRCRSTSYSQAAIPKPLDRLSQSANHPASALRTCRANTRRDLTRKEVLMAPPDQSAAIIAAAFGRASA